MNRPIGCKSPRLDGSECGGCTLTCCLRYTEKYTGVSAKDAVEKFGIPADKVKEGYTYTIELDKS